MCLLLYNSYLLYLIIPLSFNSLVLCYLFTHQPSFLLYYFFFYFSLKYPVLAAAPDMSLPLLSHTVFSYLFILLIFKGPSFYILKNLISNKYSTHYIILLLKVFLDTSIYIILFYLYTSYCVFRFC